MLPDTADAFRRRFRSSLRSTLTPLWSLTRYTRIARGYLLLKFLAARKLTVNCSLSRQSPNENASILAWLVARAYICSPVI